MILKSGEEKSVEDQEYSNCQQRRPMDTHSVQSVSVRRGLGSVGVAIPIFAPLGNQLGGEEGKGMKGPKKRGGSTSSQEDTWVNNPWKHSSFNCFILTVQLVRQVN